MPCPLLDCLADWPRELRIRGKNLEKSGLMAGTDAQMMATLISRPDQSAMSTPLTRGEDGELALCCKRGAGWGVSRDK